MSTMPRVRNTSLGHLEEILQEADFLGPEMMSILALIGPINLFHTPTKSVGGGCSVTYPLANAYLSIKITPGLEENDILF